MSLRRSIEQLRPARIPKQDVQEKVQSFLTEITISPHYQQKGVYNPFYELDIDIETDIRPEVGPGEITFANVKSGTGKLIKSYGRGKFHFQIHVDNKKSKYYVITTAKVVKSHLGMTKRKSSTASSDVNEYLSLYFIKHPKFTDVKTFMSEIGKKTGDTGVLASDGKVTYDDLRELIDKDETAERDIIIGYNNSKAVIQDLKSMKVKWSVLHWVPQAKPGGIKRNNPSDIIIELSDGSYIGYSNKISAGKDKTPKLNTGIWSAYKKRMDKTQLGNIEKMIDKAWADAARKIKPKSKNAYAVLKRFNIKKEAFSETSSQERFMELAKAFAKDKLNFFTDDMYYPFRNNLILAYSRYLKKPSNMQYLMNTVALYTYDDASDTPCPYKLLIGSESGSKLKEVVSDDTHRQVFFSDKASDFVQIKTSYDNKSQSFNAQFTHKPTGLTVSNSWTLRTRARGGWGGKNLYFTTSGFKFS
tara:strand:+ start:25 stop:1443 length:1419 start_codon:yes stop_codon:yes gene_type:complete